MHTTNRRMALAMLGTLVIFLSGCKEPVSSTPDLTPPSEVRNLETQSGDRSMQLTWDDPNEPDLDQVEIQLVPSGGQSTLVMPGIGTAILGNLINGMEYEFRVQTVDSSGNRSYGLIGSGTPGLADTSDSTPPGEVSELQTIPGDRQVALSWTPPVDIDCDKVLIMHDQSGGDSAIAIPRSRTSIVYAGLENEIVYDFTLYAEDLSGNRSSGISISASPQAQDDGVPPGPVEELSAVPGDGMATLSWTSPEDIDLNYLEFSDADTGLFLNIPASSETLTLGGLVNGEEYTVTVVAVDLGGLKSESRSVGFFLPVPGDTTPPDPVTNLDALAGYGQASLTWTEPTEDIGTIRVVVESGGESPARTFSLQPGGNGVVVAGLEPGVEHDFTVTVIDASGNTSNPETISATPLPPFEDIDPPAAPIITSLTPGNQLVSIRWTDPEDSDFDHIQITGTPLVAAISVAADTELAVIAGLANGTLYTFSLTAFDHSGNQSAAVSDTVSPLAEGDVTPPGPVTDFTASAGDGGVQLSWTLPGDSDLSHVLVSNNRTTDQLFVDKSRTSISVAGLNNELSYTFYARVYDDSGNGSTISQASATPTDSSDSTPPGPVTALEAEAGHQRVTLQWTNPADLDLSCIRIDISPGQPTVYVPASLSTAIITGLDNGQSYTFTLTAVDSSGNESAATAQAYTPVDDSTPPDNVTIAETIPGDAQVTIQWTDPSGTVNADFVAVRITNNIDSGTIVIPAGVEAAIVGGLTNDQEYTFILASLDAVGNASTGVGTTATPLESGDLTPPDNVGDLASSAGDAQASLTWTDPSGPGNEDLDHIEIECVQFPSSAVTMVAAGQEQVVFAGLVNDTAYDFTVYAADGSGNRSEGLPVSVTPTGSLDFVQPGPVIGFEALAGDSFVTLNWTDPADLDLSYIRIVNDFTSDIIFVPAGTQGAIIGGLTNGVTYTFTARAVDTSNNLSTTESALAMPISGIDETPPANVTGLEAAPGGGKAVLSWTDPADTDLNHIVITHDQTGGLNPVVVAKDTFGVAIYGLENNVLHTFTVKAVDEAGNHSTGVTTTATPLDTVDALDISITLNTPGTETVVTSGELAILYLGISPVSMTVNATLAAATNWTWYLNGSQIGSGSSSTIVSTSYTSPNPPYPLLAGVHSLVVIAEKNGLQYDQEVLFDVRNNN